MAKVRLEVERTIAATAAKVYEFLADYPDRPRILPPEFSDYRVEEGGTGTAAIISFRLRAGWRERDYRLRVEEVVRGRQLRESDTASSLVTTWDIAPAGSGDKARVLVTTEWYGAAGIGGLFERLFAPLALRRVYTHVLDRLERALAESGSAPASARP